MLFNSFAFLLVFLPLRAPGARAGRALRPAWRLPLLVALSFLFYGYWDWRFVPLLAASILVNWLVAETSPSRPVARGLIPLAIAANLLVLGFFKYFNFFADLANVVPGPAARRTTTSRCRSASRSSPSTTSCI